MVLPLFWHTNPASVLFIVKPAYKYNMSFSDLKQKSELAQEKQYKISHLVSETNQKETQKDNVLAKIQKLREEQAKRQDGTFIFETMKLERCTLTPY